MKNHFVTHVFTCALLSDETVETYEWVLNIFLDSMNDKKPCSVVTDGDKGMREAIKNLLPCARHRLCSRHLTRNVGSNMHCREFNSGFGCLLKEKMCDS